jgi:hypothetical protein
VNRGSIRATSSSMQVGPLFPPAASHAPAFAEGSDSVRTTPQVFAPAPATAGISALVLRGISLREPMLEEEDLHVFGRPEKALPCLPAVLGRGMRLEYNEQEGVPKVRLP